VVIEDRGSEIPTTDGDAADLSAAVLAEEAIRRHEQHRRDEVVVTDSLPGVGSEAMGLRASLQAGGYRLLPVLMAHSMVDEWPRVAMLVLLPDIQRTFDVSDTTVLGVAGLFGLVMVLAALPFGSLGDRVNRIRILAAGAVLWGVGTIGLGAAPSMFVMALFVILSGVGQASRLPNSQSLLADGYPLQARNTVFAMESAGRPIGQFTGPFLCAGIVAAASGGEAWRWAFYVFAIPAFVLAVVTLIVRHPERGRYEQSEVLGDLLGADTTSPPISLSAAFQRLKKVRTFYYLIVGLGAMGFALFAAPGLMSLLLEEEYGYSASERGWMLGLSWLPAIVMVPLVGRLGDRMFRQSPDSVLRLAGYLIGTYGVLFTVALRFHQPAVLLVMFSIANACQASAFALTSPSIATVVPYKMRSMAFSLVGLYLTLIGGVGGNLLGGSLSDEFGERTALTALIPPAILLGSALVIYGSRFVRRDMSLVVAELKEEQDERERMARDPGSVPVLQVRNLDYSYGSVQVLFDVDLDVHDGEVLCLLGNNGAGKSTLLRAVSGLGMPDRGVVRLNGRTITFTPAEWRVQHGIVQVRGGAGVFPGLSVAENLELFATTIDVPEAELERRLGEVYAIFPVLEQRRRQRAGSLSGGQRQMLALALALVHQPKVLVIDELSLGLAPIIVQELIAVVERLKERGQTMVIVEQSLNIALALADRAVFMEKGRIRFEGSAQDLAQRDDLVQAVFLGAAAAQS
jgi:ABC-type branched-subunit amino acid transport system ATPase component/sugar phosphate permease